MLELMSEEESCQIIRACFTIYKTTVYGFLELVCQECLEIEFKYLGIHFSIQKDLSF